MKTNYLSAPVTALNASPVTIAAWDSRSPAISQKETKRTKVRGVGFAFLLAAFLGSCATTELRAQVIVVPNTLATNDGNSFNTSPDGPGSVREMQIYDASQFGALSGPSFLTQFAYRPDTIPGPSGPRTFTLRIYASTTSRSVDGLSTTFAENLGTNNTLVFDGTVNVTTGNLPGPGNTRQFDYAFPLTTPFLYDPAAGNLLLDIQFTSDGSTIRVDSVTGDSTLGEVINFSDSNGTTGSPLPSPKVTQFTFEPPPLVVVVPNGQATNDGNSFGTTPTGPAVVRYMQIHDASQFTNALSGPAFLTQFAWRPDATVGQSGPRAATLRIYASTTSRSVAGLSTTFADNPGTNTTLVFNGTLIWTTDNVSGPGNTRQFDIVFPLSTPFLYDPAAGNLLLEFQQDAGGSAITFDRESGNPFIGQVAAPGSTNATTGSYGDSQVTQFTFALPPEVTIRLSQVEVCWNSISNLTYQVQYRSDLTTNVWTSLVDCVRSVGSTSCIFDSVIRGQPQRFYRVALTNCVPQ